MKAFVMILLMMFTISIKAQDMQRYLKEATDMVKQGKYKEGLAAYIWFHEHALEYDVASNGTRLSIALSYWKTLGDLYPPAMTALIEMRDRKANHIIDNLDMGVSPNFFHDVSALNRTLGENTKTIDLFKKIEATHPDAAKKNWRYIRDILFATQRYDILRNYLRDPLTEFTDIKNIYNLTINNDRMGNVLVKGVVDNGFVLQSLQMIQYALAINDIKSANEIQQNAILIVKDSRLLNAIPADKKN